MSQPVEVEAVAQPVIPEPKPRKKTPTDKFLEDKGKISCLEVLVGPQDDVGRVRSALDKLETVQIDALSSALNFDPNAQISASEAEALFKGHLKPVNIVPILELSTETDRKPVAEDLVNPITSVVPYNPSESAKWAQLFTADNVATNFSTLSDRLKRLTTTEFKVVSYLAENGLQKSYNRMDEETVELVMLDSGLHGCRDTASFVHVADRALDVLNLRARSNVNPQIPSMINRLLETGRKEAADKAAAPDTAGDKAALQDKVGGHILACVDDAGLKLVGYHKMISPGIVENPQRLLGGIQMLELHQLDEVMAPDTDSPNVLIARRKLLFSARAIKIPPKPDDCLAFARAAKEYIVSEREQTSISGQEGHLHVSVFPDMMRHKGRVLKTLSESIFPPDGNPDDYETALQKVNLIAKIADPGREYTQGDIGQMRDVLLRELAGYLILPKIRQTPV